MSVAQLEQANAALERRDFEKALKLLLEAWRDEPGNVLAELIDAVSRRAGEGRPSLRKAPLAAQTRQWLTVAKRRDPADFERLADVPMSRKWRESGPLVAQLLDWPKDPRVARYLHHLLSTRVFYALRSDLGYRGHETFLIELHRDLLNQGDARWADFLLEAFADLDADDQRLVRARALKKQPQPKGRAHALAASMLASFGAKQRPEKQDAKSLLAQIYERPDDLSLRAVYADALTALGDERGEFISLQLSGKRTAREAKLLKANLRGWAGKLDRFFEQEDRVYERGFFAGGRLEHYSVPKKKDLALPEWRLISHVDLVGTDQKPEPSFLDQLPSLRSLSFFHERDLTLMFGRAWPLTSLWFRLDDEDLGLARKVTPKLFPALTDLTVHAGEVPPLLSWLLNTPLLPQLKRARAEGFSKPSSGWFKKFAATSLERFVLESRGWALTFTRDAQGRLAALTVEPIWGSKTTTDALQEVLESGPVSVSSFTFVPNKRAKHLTAASVAKLGKSATR
jgi:uncharacterized protein (TIGR02996 family)